VHFSLPDPGAVLGAAHQGLVKEVPGSVVQERPKGRSYSSDVRSRTRAIPGCCSNWRRSNGLLLGRSRTGP